MFEAFLFDVPGAVRSARWRRVVVVARGERTGPGTYKAGVRGGCAMERGWGTVRANMRTDDEGMESDYEALAAALAALGKSTRLRLLALLMTFNEPLCVCELSSGLGLPDYQTSRHLVALRRAGLVAYSRQGLWAYYRPTDNPHVRFLRNVLCADSEDLARMQSRLQQRVEGRCVVGPACAAAEKERGKVSPLAATCGSRK